MTAWDGPAVFCQGCQQVAEFCTCSRTPAARDPRGNGSADGQVVTIRPGAGAALPLSRFDLAQLLRDGIPAPQLLCGGLLYAAGLHSLTGPPDCGKTFLAYHWALMLLRGGMPVAVFDEECGPEQAAEKFITLGAAPGDLAGLHYFPFPGRAWAPADVAELAAVVTAARPALAVWDSSAAFLARAGLEENDAGDVTRFWSNVLTPCARRAGAAVLVIDHDGKSGGLTRYARGSGSKLAATDVAFKLDAITPFTRAQDGIVSLTVTKDRRGWLHRSHRIEVAHEPFALAVTEDAPRTQAGRSPAQEKVLEALDQMPATIAVLTDRIAARHGHGLKRETVSKALNVLLEDGLADRTDQGSGRAALWMTRNARSDL